jgi:hypothetical protein
MPIQSPSHRPSRAAAFGSGALAIHPSALATFFRGPTNAGRRAATSRFLGGIAESFTRQQRTRRGAASANTTTMSVSLIGSPQWSHRLSRFRILKACDSLEMEALPRLSGNSAHGIRG